VYACDVDERNLLRLQTTKGKKRRTKGPALRSERYGKKQASPGGALTEVTRTILKKV